MSETWKDGTPPVFVDANILFYAFDRSKKHAHAENIIDSLFDSGRGCMSVQVLQELSVNLWKKLPDGKRFTSIQSILEPFCFWQIIEPTGEDVLLANEIVDCYDFSFWDAMIIHTASLAEARFLLTEDLQHG